MEISIEYLALFIATSSGGRGHQHGMQRLPIELEKRREELKQLLHQENRRY
jgi:hypothetical protein